MITAKKKTITATEQIVSGKCLFCGVFARAGGDAATVEVKDGTLDADPTSYTVNPAANASEYLSPILPIEFESGLRLVVSGTLTYATAEFIQ